MRHHHQGGAAGAPLAVDDRAEEDAVEPHVRTMQGEVEGGQEGGVYRFLGLPYAEPPVGELRWRAPRAPAAWGGVRDATRFGSICPQVEGATFDTRVDQQDEDCLYLNVWTPTLGQDERRPVMVWIHGGGYLGGAGSEDAFDGSRLASDHGVVVVTFNYRLGALGFASHPGIDANVGILDQVAVLRWVAANIAAFGGEPGNVTIFGQSAGATSVRSLLSAGSARGLFHRAVLESGGFETAAFALESGSNRVAEKTGELFARLGTDVLAELRMIPADKIAALSFELGIAHNPGQVHTPTDLAWMPTPDGDVIAGDGFPGWPKDAPVLLGSVDNEATYFVKPGAQYPSQLLQSMAGKLASDRAEEVLATLAREDRDMYEKLDELFTAAIWDEPVLASIERFKSAGRQVYHYRFGRVSPAHRQSGELATHTSEIRYIFGNLEPADDYDGTDADVSAVMSAAWTSFARTGVPAMPGGAPWPQHEASGPRLVYIANTVEILPDTPSDITQILHTLRTGTPSR